MCTTFLKRDLLTFEAELLAKRVSCITRVFRLETNYPITSKTELIKYFAVAAVFWVRYHCVIIQLFNILKSIKHCTSHTLKPHHQVDGQSKRRLCRIATFTSKYVSILEVFLQLRWNVCSVDLAVDRSSIDFLAKSYQKANIVPRHSVSLLNAQHKWAFFYLPYLSFTRKQIVSLLFWTGRPHSLGSFHFRGVWATCLPHKGSVPLSALPKDTTSELACLFATTSPKYQAPSREAVDTIFQSLLV